DMSLKKGRNRHNTNKADFFMKQKVHMIANVTKDVKVDCGKCNGRGVDPFQQPCAVCYGRGFSIRKLSLYEYIGQVEIAGKVLNSEGEKSYSVRYFDLGHVHEYDRFEVCMELWRDIDIGKRKMSDTLWKSNVPEDLLWYSFATACDIADDLNLNIL